MHKSCDTIVPDIWANEIATQLKENLVISCLIHAEPTLLVQTPPILSRTFSREISSEAPTVIYPRRE